MTNLPKHLDRKKKKLTWFDEKLEASANKDPK
jgi:hypothetical protein